jgi:hypothetical protein
MNRKIVAIVLSFCLLFTVGAFAQGTSTELTALDKLTNIEKVYYGAEQTGSLVERMNRLEKDVYGNITKDALMVKVDRLYDHMKTTSAASPSFILKLNAVEWSLMHNVTTQPGKARIENLEKTLTGSPSQGAFDYRLNSLLKLAYSDSHVDVGDSLIRQDSLIKVKLVTPLSSKDNRAGDPFTYAVSEDVFDNGLLVIAKGALGQGKVKKVDQAGNFGRDAKLELSFDTVEAVDGTVMDTLLGDKAKEKTNSMATAAGASAAGMVILGPVGILGGAFVHGHDIVMPVDTELYIQAKTDAHIYGIRVK